jgi:hypothetical protein
VTQHFPPKTNNEKTQRDAVLLAATCAKLGRRAVVKVYNKATISAGKARSVRREARVMRHLTEERCGL